MGLKISAIIKLCLFYKPCKFELFMFFLVKVIYKHLKVANLKVCMN